MANLHFNQPKASEPEAKYKLSSHVKGACDLVYDIKFESDDGGKHITLYMEVEDPSALLSSFLRETLVLSTWMGWRMIVLKVPPGSIKALLNLEEGS
jgi:hypothetical protein